MTGAIDSIVKQAPSSYRAKFAQECLPWEKTVRGLLHESFVGISELQTQRVVVAADSADSELIAAALRSVGYANTIVYQSIDTMCEQLADIDVLISSSDATEFCREVQGPNMPAVILVGPERDGVEAYKAGCESYATQPLALAEIVIAVNRAVAQR